MDESEAKQLTPGDLYRVTLNDGRTLPGRYVGAVRLMRRRAVVPGLVFQVGHAQLTLRRESIEATVATEDDGCGGCTAGLAKQQEQQP